MITVPQAPPKVARIRRNKVTGQLDLFAPVAESVIPTPVPLSRRRKLANYARYVFLPDGTLNLCRCSRCEIFKPLEEFSKDRNNKYGIATFCAGCTRKYNRERYHGEGGRSSRNYHLRETYGITLEQYEEMLSNQGGVCAICGGKETGRYRTNTLRSFAVDHCHETGKVRGLLCSACNTGIGSLKDSREVLQSAIAYLTIHGD